MTPRARSLWIIVLNWNGLADTRALLPTLARCTVPANWTVTTLVVDNGSSDGSVETLGAEFPDVRWLPLGENRRFAGGNNAGVSYALERDADAIMLLNNDTEADPALLERLLLALDQNPEAGAVAPLIYFAAPSLDIWYAGGVCVPALGWSAHRAIRRRDAGQFRAIEETGYLTGCCLLARRGAWERVGPLDERYYIYGEDADWSLRARAEGFRLLFVPTARLWHKVSASAGANSAWKIYQRLRANWRLWSTHAHGLGRLSWLPCFLAQQAALALWLAARGHGAAAAAVPRAIADALAGRNPAEAKP